MVRADWVSGPPTSIIAAWAALSLTHGDPALDVRSIDVAAT